MKKNILFVDDEPKILQGLMRMLRSMRNEWEMHFAESGAEALKILANRPMDVIVSDMRMPGMDGVELLKEVARHYPDVARIILSGHSDKEMILKSSMRAHQYLSKPCDAQVLKSIISRIFAIREVLQQDSLKKMVSKIESLPSLPSLYTEIMALMESPESSVKEVGKIIEKDLGMSTKILQLANSAFFGIPKHISSPLQAVNFLGLDTIKSLIVTIGIFSTFEKISRLPYMNITELMGHSLRTGFVSKELSKSEGLENSLVDQAYLAGLLHDIGKLIFAVNIPDTYQEVLKQVNGKDADILESERCLIGATHAEIGAYLLGLWGFHEPILEAVLFHHDPRRCPTDEFTPLTAVYVANALDHVGDLDSVTAEPIPGLDYVYLEKIGVSERVSDWKQTCIQIKEGERSNE
jgi:HD-like signal output (HDOD) protein/CheY-like chemotaxis protein